MKKAILALAVMAVSGTAVAGPSWTYLDFGYLRASSGDEDTDGYQLRGSIGFADMWHAQLEYLDGEADGGKGSGGDDVDGYNIIVGANPAVNDTTDLVFDLSYFDYDAEDTSGEAGIDGYGLGTGVRTMWTDALELNAGVWVLSGDVEGSGDVTEVVVRVGGNYAFTDNIVVGAEISNGGLLQQGNLANFFARYQF